MDYALSNYYTEKLNEFFRTELKSESEEYKIPISILLQLICIYNTSTLNNYPESIGLQLFQKLLVYYGRCDLITKFIDECDVKSLKHCALFPVFQCTPLSNVRTRALHNFFKPMLANQYLKIKEEFQQQFYIVFIMVSKTFQIFSLCFCVIKFVSRGL